MNVLLLALSTVSGETLKCFEYQYGEDPCFDGYYQLEPIPKFLNEKLKENQKVKDLIKQSEDLYFELLENGVKPQEARRVIPQMGYTQIWGAFMPKQLDNYFKLRLDEHAQWEIRQTAIAMQELLR